MPDDDERFAPSVFMHDYDLPDPAKVANTPLPRGVEGGVVETVKRAIVTAVRQALTDTGMTITTSAHGDPPAGDTTVYVDLEYPIKEVHYPGIWVRFSITSLKRAGIDQEEWVEQEDGTWCPMQEWEVRGRSTLSVVAMRNKDRDRLADAIISMLAFSRPANVVLTDPAKDTQQNRSLQAALINNPHIAMTLNTDVLYPGGQGENIGTPFAPDLLAYEDSWAFDILGHFNVVFRHDGVYTLTRVDVEPEIVDSVPEHHAISPWYGIPEEDGWRTL